jgi:NADH-quinone oxidoreductase subunit C
LLAFLRLHSLVGRLFLIDVTALEGAGGVRLLLYVFYLPTYNTRLFIVVDGSTASHLQTGSAYFAGLAWLEREVSEFFGCSILGMRDLRHLLLDYTFAGYPLLNQFPVCGFEELFYDSSSRWLVYRPLRLRDELASCDW